MLRTARGAVGLSLAVALLLFGCGSGTSLSSGDTGDGDGDGAGDGSQNRPSTVPGLEDLASRAYEFSAGSVFGVTSPVLLTVGPAQAGRASVAFRLNSLANSDEAAGTLSFMPCSFAVTESSFPANSRVRAGANLKLRCFHDRSAATLWLEDAQTGASLVSIACSLLVDGEEAGPCVEGGP